jgi:hypothetical protein
MEIHDLHGRLDRLERRCGRLTLAAVLCGSAAIGLCVFGAAAPASREVVAETLRIVDSQGRTRIEVTTKKDRPLLRFKSAEGNDQMAMIVTDNGPAQLTMDEKSEHLRAQLSAQGPDSVLNLYDELGRQRVSLQQRGKTPTEPDTNHLLFNDTSDKLRMSLSLSLSLSLTSLGPHIVQMDDHGVPRAVMRVFNNNATVGTLTEQEGAALLGPTQARQTNDLAGIYPHPFFPVEQRRRTLGGFGGSLWGDS